ncbi:MAG: M14-type cytosolic carboxypeptidase [Planctomycetota bacterium]
MAILSLGLVGFAPAPLAAQTLLFSDGFEDAGGWELVHFGGVGAPTAADTSRADFGFNYSTQGIPEAPGLLPGDLPTRGLRLATNTDGLWAGEQIAAVFESPAIAGQYTLQVDVWLNWSTAASQVGTTEHAGVFVGSTVAGAQGGFDPGMNGAGVVYSSDGDASCGSGGFVCDYMLVKNGAELDRLSGQYNGIDGGALPAINEAGVNNTNATLQAAFPAFDIAAGVPGSAGTGTQAAGTLGYQWVTATIEVDADATGAGTAEATGLATVSLFSHRSGATLELGTIDNSVIDDPTGIDTEERPVSMEGGIGLSITDYFRSRAADESLAFVVFDNVRVFDGLLSAPSTEGVPEPTTAALCLAALLAGVARRPRDRPASPRPRRCSARGVIAAGAVALVLAGANRAEAVLSLTGNFDHGALQSWSGDLNNVTVVGRENHPTTSGWRWLYFEATGIDGAQPVFNINQGFAGGNAALTNHQMVYSYDNQTWNFFDNNQRFGNNYVFSNSTPFTGDTVWVAYAQPYSYAMSAQHTAEVLATPWAIPTVSGDANGVIGETPIAVDDLNRLIPAKDIFAYRITNPATDSASPKRKIVITTGMHSGEVLGTHTYEGMVDWLVSDDPRAARLRDIAEVFAYPTLNAAGRFAGTSRATVQNPNQDPNGLWRPDLWAPHQDIRVNGEAMLADTQSTPGTDVDAFIDFHSTIPVSGVDDFGFIEISEGDADVDWWQELRSLQPNVDQIESTSTGETSANFADRLLRADVDVTFETEFANNRPLSYYRTLGENFGIAFYNSWVPTLEGDYNENGVVDLADYTVWRDAFGAPAGTLPNDTSGLPIGNQQYATWVARFGQTLSGSGGAIPEPTTAWVLGLTIALGHRRRATR